MTDSPAPCLRAAVDEYVVAVFREVMRVAGRHGLRVDADDLAGEVVAGVLERPEVVMASYPDPVRYARERVRHAGISFERRQRVQRGEGARLHPDGEGLLHPGRRYVSGDAPVADGLDCLFARAADPAAQFEPAADDRMMAFELLRRCCEGLSAQEVDEVWLVDGCGFEVQEIAELCGQARETVSRRLSRTRARMRQNREAMLAVQGASA
jgi:RNA polymerase sigma factor (sigma-70 family)